jgi:hypothetical protein
MTEYLLPVALVGAVVVLGVNSMRMANGSYVGCACKSKDSTNLRRNASYYRNHMGAVPKPHDENRSSFHKNTSYIILDIPNGMGLPLPADLGKSPALHPGLSSDGAGGHKWSVGMIDRMVRKVALACSAEEAVKRAGHQKKQFRKI